MADIELTIDALRQAAASNNWVVILREKGGERYLPIWIESSQAEIIRRKMTGSPSGNDNDLLFKATATICKFEIKAVRICKKTDVFSAYLVADNTATPLQCNCPLEEGLAFALRLGLPIIAGEELIDEAGINLPTIRTGQ